MTKRVSSIFKDRRVLVTGGAGFIGSHLVDRLISLSAKVSVVDNLSSGKYQNIKKNVDSGLINFYDIDIEGSYLSEAFEDARPTDVFHLAAIPSVPYSMDHPLETHYTNVIGTLNLLEAADSNNTRRVIFSSSSSVYGGADILPTPEDVPLEQKSPYALQKFVGERYCKLFSQQSKNLDTVCLRYFNVFGPRQHTNGAYSSAISAFCDALKNKSRPKIYGDGSQFRDFCYVENVVRANLRACIYKKKFMGESFNVGSGTRITINDLAKKMKLRNPVYMPTRAGDVKGSLADISKISRTLKYKPLISLDDGLKRTINWYLKEA